MNRRSLRNTTGWMFLAVIGLIPAIAFAENKRICVEVVLQKAEQALTESSVQSVQDETSNIPIGHTPVDYLKRLLEHFVTHEAGFEAVDDRCDEKVRVEMYPLEEGWTLFARYSENGREERVDQLFPRELSQYAERAVLALLNDVPIASSVNRDNVLESDSKKSAQRIKGTDHLVLGLGTQLRGGNFRTAGSDGLATKSLRIFSPMTISAGYRGKFENWGIEAVGQFGIGTSKTSPYKNPFGGHVDFGGEFGLALHFLRYFNPRGLTSFYVGAGANFEILWFSVIDKENNSYDDQRSKLFGGGLDVDLICGWEFMRASALQFYLQGELNLPAYMLDTSNYDGEVHSYFPGLSVKLGIVF